MPFLLNHRDDVVDILLAEFTARRLHHDPDDRFGARLPDEDPAGAAEGVRHLLHRRLDVGVGLAAALSATRTF